MPLKKPLTNSRKGLEKFLSHSRTNSISRHGNENRIIRSEIKWALRETISFIQDIENFSDGIQNFSRMLILGGGEQTSTPIPSTQCSRRISSSYISDGIPKSFFRFPNS
ncbi:hypothetical protein CEXT_100821 [Caerostris extrusa]|uniref:Uncharacterized protein n=1 Tax=Caerostris extrusa TaxID=172846 RepID=A0AAV4RHC6_CAEEX|nr:hypothetical protein CEXT_100821 [Caerostris extrusa]